MTSKTLWSLVFFLLFATGACKNKEPKKGTEERTVGVEKAAPPTSPPESVEGGKVEKPTAAEEEKSVAGDVAEAVDVPAAELSPSPVQPPLPSKVVVPDNPLADSDTESRSVDRSTPQAPMQQALSAHEKSSPEQESLVRPFRDRIEDGVPEDLIVAELMETLRKSEAECIRQTSSSPGDPTRLSRETCIAIVADNPSKCSGGSFQEQQRCLFLVNQVRILRKVLDLRKTRGDLFFDNLCKVQEVTFDMIAMTCRAIRTGKQGGSCTDGPGPYKEGTLGCSILRIAAQDVDIATCVERLMDENLSLPPEVCFAMNMPSDAPCPGDNPFEGKSPEIPPMPSLICNALQLLDSGTDPCAVRGAVGPTIAETYAYLRALENGSSAECSRCIQIASSREFCLLLAKPVPEACEGEKEETVPDACNHAFHMHTISNDGNAVRAMIMHPDTAPRTCYYTIPFEGYMKDGTPVTGFRTLEFETPGGEMFYKEIPFDNMKGLKIFTTFNYCGPKIAPSTE